MRQIKFRAFANGKMRYDVTGFEHGNANEMAVVFLDGDPHKIGPDCAVMQFTGLTDNKGTDIYEGDKVELEHPRHPFGTIRFIQGGFCCHVPKTDYDLDIHLNHFCKPTAGQIEVIGNIHEPVNSK